MMLVVASKNVDPEKLARCIADARVRTGNIAFIQFWKVHDILLDFDPRAIRQAESLRCMRLFRDRLLTVETTSIRATSLRNLVLEISSQTTEPEYWQSISSTLKCSEDTLTDTYHSLLSLSRGIFIWLKTFATETEKRKRYQQLPPQTTTLATPPPSTLATPQPSTLANLPPSTLATPQPSTLANLPPSTLVASESMLVASLRSRVADLERCNAALVSELKTSKSIFTAEISRLTRSLHTATAALSSAAINSREAEEVAACLHARKSESRKSEDLFELEALKEQLTTLEAQKADVDLELTSLRQARSAPSVVGVEVGGGGSDSFFAGDSRIRKISSSKRGLKEIDPGCAQQ